MLRKVKPNTYEYYGGLVFYNFYGLTLVALPISVRHQLPERAQSLVDAQFRRKVKFAILIGNMEVEMEKTRRS